MSNSELKRELQIEYRTLTRSRPDGRWSVDRLVKEIEQVKFYRADAERRAAEQKAEQERWNRAAALRIKRRGSLDQIKAGRGMTWKFYNIVRGAKSTVEYFNREREKFIEALNKNPGYALEWANGFFGTAADYETAMWIIDRFENGISEKEFFEIVDRETLRRATDMNQSTSPTSNLMNNYRRRSFAQISAKSNW